MNLSLADVEIIDVKVPAPSRSLTRAIQLWHKGLFRISRRDAELYSVQITSAGAWARIRIWNGLGRLIFHQNSTFTGSFVLNGGAEAGIIVGLEAMDIAPNVMINFRERDNKLI